MRFQITRDQLGTFVQSGSIFCCFLWVRYGAKTRIACTVATVTMQIFNGGKCIDVSVRNGANGKVEVCALSNNLCIIYSHNFYES